MYEYNLGIRFQRIVDEQPQQKALWFAESATTTYQELNTLANRIARVLLAQEVNVGDVVCISGTKSAQTFAWMIACLKIGAIYSIVDPDSPTERLRKILGTCTPKLLVAESDILAKVEKADINPNTIRVDKQSSQLANTLEQQIDDNLPQTHRVTGADPAYIMFTSGSTGVPKGAVMTHGNVLNLIEWSKDTFNITADDILTNVNPLFFDNSVFDFYAAIFNGVCLVPFTKEEVQDPQRLVQKVDEAQCTLWFSVPSLLIFLQTMRATDGKRLKSIRRFVFGGEGYPKTKLKALYDAYADESEFFNVYGPTECTCICSSYKITPADFVELQGLPSLGTIADNFRFLILDEDEHEVPQGETGELCLLGPNVGKGYYNQPELTAASFVRNPNNDSFDELMYKTGDLVLVDPVDGKLWIQGRKDNQIKHMGYRIELEEIEIALHCLKYVSEAAVLHTAANGLSRIIAVVASQEALDEAQIRLDLRQIIPDYMVPSTFYREGRLPKNANGKVDRRSLAEKYLEPQVQVTIT